VSTDPAALADKSQIKYPKSIGDLVSCNLDQLGEWYRPAMDGFRGLFVLFVIAFHFGATFLSGGWIGINHFFVFSGFLIGKLLVKEFYRTGTVQAVRFYIRRFRRIMPALTFLVVAVLIHSWIFKSGDPEQDAGDGFASLTFWLNWRLIARDDQYFDLFGQTPALRHVWTLAVEEQFYIIIPFLILAVFIVFKTRMTRFLAFAGLAIASAVWTSHLVETATGSRLYYGTDIRMQAILVGVAAAVIHTGHPRGGKERLVWSKQLTNLLAWASLVVTIGSFFFLGSYTRQIFEYGGMVIFAILAAFMGLAALDTRGLLITRLLEFRPLVHLGQISYGLYLYHWPIGLWFPFDGMPRLVAGLLQFFITWVVSVLSYRLLELPIMLFGVRGFVPWARLKRVAGVGLWAAASVFAYYSWGNLTGAVNAPWNGYRLVAQDQYHAPRTPLKLAVVGNSIPGSLTANFPGQDYPGLTLLDHAGAGGCSPVPVTRYIGGHAVGDQPSCKPWRDAWPGKAKAEGANAVLAFADPSYSMRVVVNGVVAQPETPLIRQALFDSLDGIKAQSKASGATQLNLANVPCWRVDPDKIPSEIRSLVNKDEMQQDPKWLNAQIAQWVKDQPAQDNVRLVDIYTPLCGHGYQPTIGGNKMYKDGFHFTPSGAGVLWTFIAPEVARNWDAVAP
jgi:peptidoglycan/LPS O-acetylase OafA/YrhL